MKAVIICYSLSGNTRRVAAAIAERIGGEVIELWAPAVLSGGMAMLRWGFAALMGQTTPIHLGKPCPTDVDLVILAAPVWAGRVAVPMRTWLSGRPQLPVARALVMTGGSPTRSKAAMTQFAKLADAPAAPQLYVSEQTLRQGQQGPLIETFCQALGA
jgi:hypothetical protein